MSQRRKRNPSKKRRHKPKKKGRRGPANQEQRQAPETDRGEVAWWRGSGVRLTAYFCCGVLAACLVTFVQRSVEPDAPSRRPEPARPASITPVRSPAINSLLARGVKCLVSERIADAHRAFTRASELAPKDARPYRGLGDVYRLLDRDQLAEQAYRTACELDPGFLAAKVRLAHVLCRLGSNDEAVTLLNEALQQTPDDPILWVALATNAMRLGKPAEAIPWIEKYNAVRGKQVWGLAHLGRALAELGRVEEAEKAYREAIATDPKTTQAYLWLGQLLVTTGRRAEAERMVMVFRENMNLKAHMRRLQLLLLGEPNNVKTLRELARARYRLGRVEDALRVLRRAISLAPEDSGLRALYEEYSEKLKQSPR